MFKKLSALLNLSHCQCTTWIVCKQINLFHIILSKEFFSFGELEIYIRNGGDSIYKQYQKGKVVLISYLVSDDVKNFYFLKKQCYGLEFRYWNIFHILGIPTFIMKKYYKLFIWMKANVVKPNICFWRYFQHSLHRNTF